MNTNRYLHKKTINLYSKISIFLILNVFIEIILELFKSQFTK